MPSPLKPDAFCSLTPSGTSSLCDRLLRVFIQMPAQLCSFFSWMLNSDGTLTQAFKDEAQIIPTGTVIARMSTVVPTGWLECNGQAVSRTTHALLFSVIGTVFGVGNGSTTFNVPDLRDKFIYGKGSTSNVGDTGGESDHVLTTAELPAHAHAYQIDANPSGAGAELCINNGVSVGAGGGFIGIQFGGSTSTKTTGSSTAHNNLPPFIRAVFLIKT